MRSKEMYRFAAVLCFLATSACDRLALNSTSEQPPATSYRLDDFALDSGGVSQTIRGASVTPVFFEAAKARPMLGRVFVPEEYQSGRDRSVVLSDQFWRQRFKGDPASIGKTLRLNGKDRFIIGVMPPAFEIPSGVDVWLPGAGSAN